MSNLAAGNDEQKKWLAANDIPKIVDSTVEALLAQRPADEPFTTMITELTKLRGVYGGKKCEEKMKEAKLSDACIQSFLAQHGMVAKGETGTIPESTIEPVTSIKSFGELDAASDGEKLSAILRQTVVMKLNGGLGTSMGLEKAKSLLRVKGENAFLDIMAQQVLQLRNVHKCDISFMLMNSFSTSSDTKAHFGKYPEFAGDKFTAEVELLQNKVPKVRQDTLYPAAWPADVDKEWCPPGHGDIYAALLGSGKLQALLDKGFKYMFVSNSDNLGATLDTRLLSHFADSGAAFLMEVCERGESDKKGGHLAKSKDGGLLLREAAQCAKDDEPEFQNIAKHKYFNTNNLWVNLEALDATMKANKGVMPLPVIRNSKTVDPTNSSSTKVYQLETAMGAAISAFGTAASAVVVPRDRFSPVKTCNDLFSLRSDAYTLTEDHRVVLEASRTAAPIIDLDTKLYKFVDDMEKLFADAGEAPSLVKCERLTVRGPVAFKKGVVFEGKVTVTNSGSERKELAAGTYKDQDITL
eukprot:PhM_4_TR10473/c2_g2_i1/m.69441/K00963/UGP2, galU, galF; UTP--glucose-1-phosphate uridylyltransferase